jgi:hypothetical protein
MNERLVFRFSQGNQPLSIDEVVSIELDRGGLVLNGETSAWPRALRFDFEGAGLFKERLDLLRRQTANGEHRFSLEAQNGALAITTVSPNRIPTGTYDFRLRIADLDLENGNDRVRIKEGETPIDIRIRARPERVAVTLADTVDTDTLITDVINGSSQLDGKRIREWLEDDAPRPKRKACFLNLLAKLRTTPTEEAPLIPFIENVFHADVDRIYARVDGEFLDQLQELSEDPQQPFTVDLSPIHPTHLKLLRRIPREDQDVTEKYVIRSFRQDSQPSLHIVMALPPDDKPGRGIYADIDIDLGNPKRDLAGFFVHLGELIAEGQTDHIKLARRLKGDLILSPHLHYRITPSR